MSPLSPKNREYLFGEIKDDEMVLNDAGMMVETWFVELENKFPDIQCHTKRRGRPACLP